MTRARAALLAATATALLVALAGVPVLLPIVGVGAVALGVDAAAHRRRERAGPTVAGSQGQDVSAALAALTEPWPAAVLLFDADQRVLAANPAARELAGRPREQLVGVSLIRAFRHHALAELARTAGSVASEAELDSGRRVRATAAPVEAGAAKGVLLLEDVTELHRARRARTELVANVSHELRTPLTAARALAETLEMELGEYAGDGEETQARFAARLVEEIDRLGGIVDRLLRLSRLEAQDEPFEVETLLAGSLLQVAAERIAPVARARSVRVTIAQPVDAGAGPALRADRERLLEVLSNLLDNALRATPRGSVVTLDARADGAEVVIEVADEGPGIVPAARERIFERFYTGDDARTSSATADATDSAGGAAGTGLGLAIARHIVLRLGGRIWVADRHPGATLCVALPRVELAPVRDAAGRAGQRDAPGAPTP